MNAPLKQWKQQRRETTCPCTDFENPQSASFGQTARRFLQGAADARHPVAGEKSVAVEMIEQLGSWPREQHLDRVFFSANDRAKFATCARTKEGFGQMSRMLQYEVAEDLV